MENKKKVDLSWVKLNKVKEQDIVENELQETEDIEVEEQSEANEIVDEVEKKTETTISKSNAKKQTKKKYELHELIPCRSVTMGELGLDSKKTNNTYYWGNYGDVCEVSYEDLLFLKAQKSGFLYNPSFIIEADDVFPEDKTLVEIKELYDRFINLADFFELNTGEIKEILKNAPEGFRDVVATKAGEMVRSNRLESLAVIKIIDAIVGTNLKMFIS